MAGRNVRLARRPLITLGMPALLGAIRALTVAPVAAMDDETGADSAFIDVPTYRQQRNLSCEYAAAVIVMGAFGQWVSEWEFDDIVGWSDNPHWGFRGDINGWWGNTVDYGVYPEPLVAPLAQFGFWSEAFYGQGDPWKLKSYLHDGVPVIVWLGLWGDQSFYEYTGDGTPYKLTPGYHVVVAHGYDESGVYVSDPARAEYNFYPWGDFMWMWNVLDGMSLAAGPAG